MDQKELFETVCNSINVMTSIDAPFSLETQNESIKSSRSADDVGASTVRKIELRTRCLSSDLESRAQPVAFHCSTSKLKHCFFVTNRKTVHLVVFHIVCTIAPPG